MESLSLKGEDMNKFGDYRDCRQFQGSKKKRRRVEFAQREEKRVWIRVKAEALSANIFVGAMADGTCKHYYSGVPTVWE